MAALQQPRPVTNTSRRGSRSDSTNWRLSSGQTTRASNRALQSGPLGLPPGLGLADRVERSTQVSVKGVQDRFAALSMGLIGLQVELQQGNGSVFRGVFSSESREGVVLKMACLVGECDGKLGAAGSEAARKVPLATYFVPRADVVQILAKDVALGSESATNGRIRGSGEIVTDTGISRGMGRKGGGRELEPWKPEAEDMALTVDLESTNSGSSRKWDQFQTNREKFGVESRFDESLYTTKLEKPSREREREATELAREIESQGARNAHQAEERGLELPPGAEDMDEETRFSSVIREANGEVDMGLEDEEDAGMDGCNDNTFGPATPNRQVSGNEILKGDTEFHKDHLRLRLQPRRGGSSTSPYSSPLARRSPHLSPLMGGDASMQALNLDPSCPQVPEEVYREFHDFKLAETAKKGKKQRADIAIELKSFSETLRERTVRDPLALLPPSPSAIGLMGALRDVAWQAIEPRSPLGKGSAAPDHCLLFSVSPPVTSISSSAASRSSGSPSARRGGGTPMSPDLRSPFSSGLSQTSTPPLPSPVLHPSGSSGSDDGPGSRTDKAVARSSSLNPHAKEFKLNPNAPVFTPNPPPLPLPAGRPHGNMVGLGQGQQSGQGQQGPFMAHPHQFPHMYMQHSGMKGQPMVPMFNPHAIRGFSPQGMPPPPFLFPNGQQPPPMYYGVNGQLLVPMMPNQPPMPGPHQGGPQGLKHRGMAMGPPFPHQGGYLGGHLPQAGGRNGGSKPPGS